MTVKIDFGVADKPVESAAPEFYTMPPAFAPSIRIEMTHDGAGKLTVEISTERLSLRSVSQADAENLYQHIYGCGEVMAKFQNGNPWTPERFSSRLATWIGRWEQGDPFSAFSIYDRSGEFVGVAVLGHGSVPGRSELAFAVRRELWGQGYGQEALRGLVSKFAAVLRAERACVEGAAFHEVEATARVDNIPSLRILAGLNMDEVSSTDPVAATAAQYDLERRLYVGNVPPADGPSLDVTIDLRGEFFVSQKFL